MRDFEQEIGALWQSQPVKPIDTAKIRARLRTLRIKHRLYLVIDCLALVPLVYIFFWAPNNIEGPEVNFLLVMGVMSVIYTVYLTWLRRLSLFSGKTTQDYLQLFRRQLENNIRIARVTKHSAWCVQLTLMGFYTLLYARGGLEESKEMPVVIAIAAAGVVNLIFYVWAAKRQLRFHGELAQLNEKTG